MYNYCQAIVKRLKGGTRVSSSCRRRFLRCPTRCALESERTCRSLHQARLVSLGADGDTPDKSSTRPALEARDDQRYARFMTRRFGGHGTANGLLVGHVEEIDLDRLDEEISNAEISNAGGAGS